MNVGYGGGSRLSTLSSGVALLTMTLLASPWVNQMISPRELSPLDQEAGAAGKGSADPRRPNDVALSARRAERRFGLEQDPDIG